MTESADAPRRRIALELSIEADDRESLLQCLDAIRLEVRRGLLGHTTGGTTDVGYAVTVSDDGQTTPHQYVENLRDYLESIRREGC